MKAHANHQLTEHDLDWFRDNELTTERFLELLRSHGIVLARKPPGVGKSYLVDRMLTDAATFMQFEKVVYVAPTWAIIHERSAFKGESIVPYVTLDPRPANRCGDYRNEQWSTLTDKGLVALGRQKICTDCPNNTKADPCPWPRPLAEKVGESRLVFCTEQMVKLRPDILMRLAQLAKGKILVVLDEAKFINSLFGQTVSVDEIEEFQELIEELIEEKELDDNHGAMQWVKSLGNLNTAIKRDTIRKSDFNFPPELNAKAAVLQAAGTQRFGDDWRYIGFLLQEFRYSEWSDRHVTMKRDAITFLMRPRFPGQTLILGGYHKAEYVQRRLGLPEIYSPFEHHQILHTGTRVYNIKGSLGAKSRFSGNLPQISDFFAVLLVRNVVQGRSTVLVACKDFKAKCSESLKSSLKKLGFELDFITDNYGNQLHAPDPRVIPIIHFGIFGINLFEHYDCCYCLMGYFVNPKGLQKLVFDGMPAIGNGYDLKISVDREAKERYLSSTYFQDEVLANYLFEMEIETVLNTVARVRFYTKPREIIMMQMYDMSTVISSKVQSFRNLPEAAKGLEIPRATHLKNRMLGLKAGNLLEIGYSVRKVGHILGISKDKVQALKQGGHCTPPTINELECRGFPFKLLIKEIPDTLIPEGSFQ